MPWAHDSADSWISDIAGSEWPLARTVRIRGAGGKGEGMEESGSTKPGSAGRLKAPELPGKCSFRYHYRDVPAPLPPSVHFFFSFLFFPRVRDWCVGLLSQISVARSRANIGSPARLQNFPIDSLPDKAEVHLKEAVYHDVQPPVFKIMSLFLLPSQNLFRQSDIKSTMNIGMPLV